MGDWVIAAGILVMLAAALRADRAPAWVVATVIAVAVGCMIAAAYARCRR